MSVIDAIIAKKLCGGGGSVPKPLTYDYMPEGYPKKSVGTVIVMEEQELAFADRGGVYAANLPDGFKVTAGQTYVVNWDGTEYECVGFVLDNVSSAIGNASIAGESSSTTEPFLYAYDIDRGIGMFGTPDTSASHTISVKTTGEVATPMAEEFLPVIVAKIKATADNAKTAADNAKTAADNANNIASKALPLSGGEIQIRGGNAVATLKLSEFTAAAGDVQKRGIQIGGSGAYGYRILEVTSRDITIYDSLTQRRVGGLNSEELFLKSKNSTKIFKITVDDSGTISATEVT